MGETQPVYHKLVRSARGSFTPPHSSSNSRPGGSFREMPPSRQERRKAEREAAKRAPSNAGAAGDAGAAAALANLNVNPLGHWTTQAEDPCVGPGGYCPSRHVIGCPLLKRRTFTSLSMTREGQHAE